MPKKAKKDSVIVSLTSFGPRMKYVPQVVKSILDGTMKPYKIVITLTEQDAESMPDELKSMIEDGTIELMISDSDIKGHKKYFDVMMTYKEYPIVTIDDDFIYDERLVETLYNSYKENPDVISCVWARDLFLKKDGTLPKYKEIQRAGLSDSSDDPSHSRMILIGSGTIFPPDCLKLKESDIICINRFITVDDVVVLYFAMRNGIAVKRVDDITNMPFSKSEKDIYDNSLYVTVNQTVDKNGMTPNEVAMNELILPFLSGSSASTVVYPLRKKYPEGISICITAYHTKNYIKNTLDSVARQTWFKDHDCFEILIGVDGDEELCDYLRDEIMGNYKNIRVFMMDSNVGTYTVTNTIMKQAKYSNLIRFDSDDLMRPDLVESIVPYAYYDVVKFGCWSGGSFRPRDGVIMVKKSVFEEFGGYMPWRCAGDSQFLKRLKDNATFFTVDKGLYDYVVREDSLTHDASTNMKSELRAEYRRQINASTYPTKESAVIECVTSPFTEVFSTMGEVDKDAYLASILKLSGCQVTAKDEERHEVHQVITPPSNPKPNTYSAQSMWGGHHTSTKKNRPWTPKPTEPKVSSKITPEAKSRKQGQRSYVASPVWSPIRKK